MSPELDLLDQLLAGNMPLAVLLRLFPSIPRARHAIHAMLAGDEIRLIGTDGAELQPWQWQALSRASDSDWRRAAADLTVSLAPKAAERVA